MLVDGANVLKRAVQGFSQEKLLARTKMLVNVQRKTNPTRSRNVVKHHAQSGPLVNGANVPRHVVVDHKHEL